MKRYDVLAASLLSSSFYGFAQEPDLKDFNVVFIISDQHKKAVTGCYGDHIVKTPNIDALAKTGILFTRMYTASPLSAPSRASLITGTLPSTNGDIFHQMPVVNKNGETILTEAGKFRTGYDEKLITWGEFFKKNNFSTAAIGKMHVHGELQKGVNPDYPNGNLMGFDLSDMRFYTYFPGGHYRDYKNNPEYYERYREIGPFKEKQNDNQYNQQMKPTLLEKQEDVFDFIVADKSDRYMEEMVKNKKQFVIHVGLEKPHKPWTTLPKYMSMYKPEEMVLPRTWRDWHDNGRYPYVKAGTQAKLTDTMDIKRSMVSYYACVSEMDDAVGKVVQKVKDLGIYDKTIFVYTTDHGEHLFEHGFHEKHNMFEDAVNIPFIISCPALISKQMVCNSLASLIDVLPTLAELLNLKPEPQWKGRSLVSQFRTRTTPWDRQVFSEFYESGYDAFPNKDIPMRMLLDNKYKYVYTHGMLDQLFDIKADKDEMNNLVPGNQYIELVKKYRLMTLNNWRINIFPQMSGKISSQKSNTTLSWEKLEEAENYNVWRSKTGKVEDAEIIAEVAETEYVDSNQGTDVCYWVTANWKYTRNGERKVNIPMITSILPQKLPVTPMLKTIAN
ncbi:MAG: sulfatase-like hydrolase/transferase [Bacteroidia bacterium]|nr:sulfatase-like hydrolase/transferase [Bacteroidia bacterium]